MLSFNVLLSVCLIYVAILFLVAAISERRANAGKLGFLQSPVIYTLSISVYCTAWTFYGAVGSAARNGLEFVAIYLGPTLVFLGWWWLLRKLVRIGRTQRITSIADLISSRYGKSASLAVVVTVLAVVGTTPYIALQLQSLTLSFSVFTVDLQNAPPPQYTALWIAIGMALFTIVFGTRNIDANERHYGVVTAIALEAVVKLLALLSVGVFVVWGVASGPVDILSRIDADAFQTQQLFGARWVTLVFLSATAIICLPRMFQVVVVESSAERHLATASWAFPLYLFLMSLFVLPIAIAGRDILPPGSNPDLFVLTVPLAAERESLALFAFLGGFSSATSMVIVAAIALSTMVSNHIVLPVWLRMSTKRNSETSDVRRLLLRSRRISIAGVLALGYLYYIFTGGSDALASIGLIAFLGVAQVLPALLGGLFWKNATRIGATSGIVAGFAVWMYTLLLPSFNGGFLLTSETLEHGLFHISALTPYALFGSEISDPLVHAVVWSLAINAGAFVIVSLLSVPSAIERLQAVQFINVFDRSISSRTFSSSGTPEELLVLAQRVLGREEAYKMFEKHADAQGRSGALPEASNEFIALLERKFAGSVGAAAAHAMISQVTSGEAVSVEELIAVADETAQIMEYSSRLESQSKALAETAQKLTQANRQLKELGDQKDHFLSQVSHELRTPMTSIRSFAEILRDAKDLEPERLKHFSTIILDESVRLTRLLDEILDLSFLESGKVQLRKKRVFLEDIVERAVLSTQTLAAQSGSKVTLEPSVGRFSLYTDSDRLAQVLINLLTNAIKYGVNDDPEVRINARMTRAELMINVTDNGPGIPKNAENQIFEKFARLSQASSAGSAGLGLAISREIVKTLGGDLIYVRSRSGSTFRIVLPMTTSRIRRVE
jgi:Na+/proline symporter/nitrogen-specific signal transduction histidine kinase